MPSKVKGSKGNKIGARQRQFAWKWLDLGLVTDEGFRAVEDAEQYALLPPHHNATLITKNHMGHDPPKIYR
jgi:hypothetical protein